MSATTKMPLRLAITGFLSASLLLGVGTPSSASSAPANSDSSTTHSYITMSDSQKTSDEDWLKLADAIDKMPADLKTADPKTTPNYEARIKEALAQQGISTQNPGRGATTYTNPAECIAAAVPFAFSMGFPAFKIAKVIRTAYKEWGSMSMAITAIQNGEGVAELGEEGLNILKDLTGIGAVKSACFS